jgi:hypothetical protein
LGLSQIVASFVSFERFFSFLLHVRLVALLTDIDGLRMFALPPKAADQRFLFDHTERRSSL